MLRIFIFLASSHGVAQNVEVATRNLQYSDQISTAGIAPVQTIHVANAQFDLSKPFRLDQSHQIAVAWITIDDERAIRVLYRSNSQCCWRMCDAITSNHIGKGFHEFDKQVPIAVTLALHKSHQETGLLRPWFEAEEDVSQEVLSRKLLELLTIERDSGLKSGEVIAVNSGYVTLEYASIIPVMPTQFSIVHGHVNTSGGGRVANPERTRLPNRGRLPDLNNEIESVKFVIPSYATFSGTSGQLVGRVFLSHDEKLKYFFVEDNLGRVMLSCVEMLSAPMSILGLRTQYLDVSGMDTPLLEYASQIPEEYGGRRKNRYQVAWNWVRELPIIQHYYQKTGRVVPPEYQTRSTK